MRKQPAAVSEGTPGPVIPPGQTLAGRLAQLQELTAEMLAVFRRDNASGSGYTARVSADRMAGWRRRS